MCRIIFGDLEAYKEKFQTCARTRIYGQQILGSEFYQKEHTKPLFEKHNILTVQNLYNFHCFMEVFKILKNRSPHSIFSQYIQSNRDYLSHIQLTPPAPTTHFVYRSSIIWNILREKLKINDISQSTSIIKHNLRVKLHCNQHRHSKLEWLNSHDFDISKL